MEKKILIVDNDEFIRSVSQEILEQAGCRIGKKCFCMYCHHKRSRQRF